jgi:hypothetical protein
MRQSPRFRALNAGALRGGRDRTCNSLFRLREMDSKWNWPDSALAAAISESYFLSWYEGRGEKCILQPLSRATEDARLFSGTKITAESAGFERATGHEVRLP